MRKRILIVLLGLTMMSQVAYAAEVHIAFSTAVQTVAPGVISEKITVQSQDASGQSQNIAETGDLLLSSNSATGEFSSSNTTWKAVSQVTVSKNTANRSFYYKDPTAGAFTLTAKLTLRDSGAMGTASQNITIGTVVATTTPQTTTATATSQTTASSSTSSSQTTTVVSDTSDLSAISAHDSPLPTSEEVKMKLQLVADAGRERIGTTHTPLTFSVLATDQAGKRVTSLDATWSFGDGTSVHGEAVQHTYIYPGDYVVIMNTQKGDLAAVDRTLVHILPATVAISRVKAGMMNDEIEVANQGKVEINLARWSLSNGTQSYVFPPDTIVLPGKQITLPYAVTKIAVPDTSFISLLTPDQTIANVFTVQPPRVVPVDGPVLGQIVITATTTVVATNVPADRAVTLAEVRRKIVAIQKELAPEITRPFVVAARATPATVPAIPSQPELSRPLVVRYDLENPTPAVTIVVAKKPTGFFANIMALFK